MTKGHCGFPDVVTPEWEVCIRDCLLSMNDGLAIDCWLFYEANGYWNPDFDCYQRIVECDCIEFLEVVPAPDPEVINCLRTCEVPGMGECLEYYDAFGVWTKECNNLIDECGCGEDEPTHPGETPIDRDMRDCALNCSNDAFNCWSIFHETGEWSEACKDIMRNCDCYDPDDQHDCYRKALNYIKNELILEPYSNACAVLEYVLTHFNCIPRPLDPNEPGIPGDLPDDWDDDGGTDPDPGATDGPYDEDQRKPIWWYHSDHLGSSTYLTDNFGRPSHYYETLPFGEMIVEHNQSSFYDNKFKFNGKELDDATQMYYYGARYYDPRISIFVSVDPLAEETMTPYQYVNNNPIMFTDPTGMVADDIIIRGENGNTITIPTADDDHKYVDVPFDISESITMDLGLSNINTSNLAVGYSMGVSADAKAAVGGAASANMTVVNFPTNSDYSDYNYVYAGYELTLSGGAQVAASANIEANFFVAYSNTKDTQTPSSFQGKTSSYGLAFDVKAVAGAGFSIYGFQSEDKVWTGVGVGLNVGVGKGLTIGAWTRGESNSVMLSNQIPTNQRNFSDRFLNGFSTTTMIGQAMYQYFNR